MINEHDHFVDWLRFVRKRLCWTEDFIQHQVSSAMKGHSHKLDIESKVLLRMKEEPHNITHINVYAFG